MSELESLILKHGMHLDDSGYPRQRVTDIRVSMQARPLELVESMGAFSLFDDAIVFFPSVSKGVIPSLSSWNSADGWRQCYDIPPATIFFAEDVLSNQFGYLRGCIVSFDPESGELTEIAENINEWASLIIDEPDFYSGAPLLRQWNELREKLKPTQRLAAIQPFVLGGAYSLENLMAMERRTAMDYHGEIFTQIRDLPDGSSVHLAIE